MKPFIYLFTLLFLLTTCKTGNEKIRVIFDTDANNELDDQHALAYLLLNGKTFDVKGVTVNATHNGGNIDSQYEEAARIIKLCGLFGRIPVYKGANSSYDSIHTRMQEGSFDGSEGVNFIIEQAHKADREKLVVIAVGKITNMALALHKDTSIASKIRLVWLGSNYPEYGEYNLVNDTAAVNYLLDSQVEFEMVMVRGGRYTGTYAVSTTMEEIEQKMPGKGPVAEQSVQGRDGEYYTNFGDYSVSLFKNMGGAGKPDYSRPLYDMAAVAIVKEPSFASHFDIPAPILRDRRWTERRSNKRMIRVWEHFNKEAIINDFYETMNNYKLVETD